MTLTKLSDTLDSMYLILCYFCEKKNKRSRKRDYSERTSG